uniref:phage major capsid protein n=1 Tax=Candidatus Scatocola faecigallinarum TaxID=2840916 RepID=UPI004025DDE4
MSTNAETLERQMPKLIPEIWSLSLNKKLDKSGVGMKIVNKIYEKDIKNFGDTVNIGELGDVTVSDYSEDASDGGVTYQRVDATSQQLKLDQSKSFGIFLSDITQKQSNIKELQAKFEERARTAIDLVKDTFILSAFSEIPADNKQGATTAITLTPDNAYKCLVWLSKTLKNNNAVQVRNDQIYKTNQAAGAPLPWCVINPDVEAIIRQAPEFIHATQAGDRLLREGSIGTIAGLDVLVCTNLPTTTKKVNIMAGINEAIAYAGNISKVESMRDDKFFGDNVRGLYVYGKKVVLPKALAGMVVDVTAADTLVEATSGGGGS